MPTPLPQWQLSGKQFPPVTSVLSLKAHVMFSISSTNTPNSSPDFTRQLMPFCILKSNNKIGSSKITGSILIRVNCCPLKLQALILQ